MNSNYLPKKFLQLGQLLASWTYDERAMSSWPEIIEDPSNVPGGHNQRFFKCKLGESDLNGANLALFWYDEFNDEFGYVTELDLLARYPEFDSKSFMEMFDEIGGHTFDNLELLAVHLLYGVS
jgi:hypothetical protein